MRTTIIRPSCFRVTEIYVPACSILRSKKDRERRDIRWGGQTEKPGQSCRESFPRGIHRRARSRTALKRIDQSEREIHLGVNTALFPYGSRGKVGCQDGCILLLELSPTISPLFFPTFYSSRNFFLTSCIFILGILRN